MTNPKQRIRKASVKLKKRNPNNFTFLEHFKELRKRLFVVAIVFILGSLLGYFIHDQLLTVLFQIYDQKLFYTAPTSGIALAMKVSIAVGFIVSIPFVCYQLYKFIKPAFPKVKPQAALKIVSVSALLATVGVSFAYFATLPATLHFFGTFGVGSVEYFVSVTSYVCFVLQYLGVFALVFQLPLILVIWNRFVTINPRAMMRYQMWIIVACFTVAAIFTPTPDPVNQFMMAAPLVVLYEFSILLIYLINRRRTAK